MTDLDRLKSDVADLLIEVAKRRKVEAAKKRQKAQIEYDKEMIRRAQEAVKEPPVYVLS